jgi:hypothetical protein
LRVNDAGLDPFDIDAQGVGQSLTASPSDKPNPLPLMPFAFTRSLRAWILSKSEVMPVSTTSGVGHNPDPVASVRRANGASWYAVPLRIIPERGQGSENGIQPSRKQRSDVLQDDEAWSQFANKTGDFVEQAAPLACEASAKSCKANVLAREPAADDIDGNSIGSKSFAGKGADIIVAGDVRPVLCEDFAGELFDFAERDCFKAIVCGTFQCGALQPKGEAANSAEQIEEAQLCHSAIPIIVRGPHEARRNKMDAMGLEYGHVVILAASASSVTLPSLALTIRCARVSGMFCPPCLMRVTVAGLTPIKPAKAAPVTSCVERYWSRFMPCILRAAKGVASDLFHPAQK